MSTREALMTAAAVVAVLVTGTACTSGSTAGPAPTTTVATPTPIPAPPTTSGVTPSPLVNAPPTVNASAPAMPTGAPGRPRGLPTTAVDPMRADSVATAFATTTFTYDTARDVSEFDAQTRSARYATPAFAAQLTTPLAQTGSATFTELAAHQGFTTVALKLNVDDGQPPDELRSAARSYTVTVTGQGNAGWTAPIDTTTVYVFLVRTEASAPWQVDRVTFGRGQ